VLASPMDCISTVPTAGPTAVPPEKAAKTGALVRARLSAVLISDTQPGRSTVQYSKHGVMVPDMYKVPPATNIDTPMPESNRHPMSHGVPSPGKSVKPIDPMPTAQRPIPAIITGFRPYSSTKKPQGMFPNSFATPNAEFTIPNSYDGMSTNTKGFHWEGGKYGDLTLLTELID
jgi:hypothetical protein